MASRKQDQRRKEGREESPVRQRASKQEGDTSRRGATKSRSKEVVGATSSPLLTDKRRDRDGVKASVSSERKREGERRSERDKGSRDGGVGGQRGDKGGRGEGERRRHGEGERSRRGEGDRSGLSEGDRSRRGEGERSRRGEGDRSGRSEGGRSGRGEDKSRRGEGDRSGRSEGGRSGRSEGDRSRRGEGDRGGRGEDKSRRGEGDRSGRGEGDRSGRGGGGRSGRGEDKSGHRDDRKRRSEGEKGLKDHVRSDSPLAQSHTKTQSPRPTRKTKEIPEEVPVMMEEVEEQLSQGDTNHHLHDYGNYGDDFEEDYDEDFEEILSEESDHHHDDDDDGHDDVVKPRVDDVVKRRDDAGTESPVAVEELQDVMKAVQNENENIKQVKVAQELHPTAPPPHTTLSPRRPLISFTASTASQRQTETGKKMRTRANELSSLIEREVTFVDLFELAPLTEYDLYMRSFGQDSTRQVGVQTMEDCEDKETETDVIATVDVWTQWPPHDIKGYGGRNEIETEDVVLREFHSEKLLRFMQTAGKVCEMLLEEESMSSTDQKPHPQDQPVDPYYTKAASLSVGGAKKLCCVDWSSTHPQMIVTACCHDDGQWRGQLDVWQISRPSSPQYSLGNHGVPVKCCIVLPLVFAGNDDGSIVLWDLREPLSMHQTKDGLRIPTFTTASLGWNSGHCEPIISMTTTSTDTTYNNKDWREGNSKGLSYQLLSLDGRGNLCIWVVVELPIGDPAGSEADLGLAPGGRVKLVASSNVNIFSNISSLPDGCRATCLTTLTINNNTLLIGTDEGAVVRHVRYKARVVPKTYRLPSSDECLVSTSVSSISPVPGRSQYFLTGYTSGHLSLFHINHFVPLSSWPPISPGPVSHCQWCPLLPSVCVGVWNDKEIHVWDLLTNDSKSLHSMTAKESISSLLCVEYINGVPSIAVGTVSGDVTLYHLSQLVRRPDHLTQLGNYFLTLV